MLKFSACKTMFLVCVFCAVGAISSPAQSWPLTTFVSFNGTNGQQPLGSVIQGTDGNFYGTTYWGGACFLASNR
jgi:hypothetical protein